MGECSPFILDSYFESLKIQKWGTWQLTTFTNFSSGMRCYNIFFCTPNCIGLLRKLSWLLETRTTKRNSLLCAVTRYIQKIILSNNLYNVWVFSLSLPHCSISMDLCLPHSQLLFWISVLLYAFIRQCLFSIQEKLGSCFPIFHGCP